jgi:hypothetical protein
MTSAVASGWEAKRTKETRKVEDVLRRAGFEKVDAYRYNSASIRLRVIDGRFEGLSLAKRDAMVEPFIAQLPERTQGDIVTLFTFAPKELRPKSGATRELLLNLEFENESRSTL